MNISRARAEAKKTKTKQKQNKTIKISIQERVRKLEADFSKNETKIHRFPRALRGIGGPGDRYIVPSVVALGPYHHGSTHLQEMEEVKHAAAQYFCAESGHSVEEVYAKILTVAGEARGCYAEDAVAHISDAEFAAMMFLDGCFLLQYIGDSEAPLVRNRMVLSTGPCMLRDIMLLENQLPWLVLEALMTFNFKYPYVEEFTLTVREFLRGRPREDSIVNDEEFIRSVMRNCLRYRVPHLLGLARLYLTGIMPHDEEPDSDDDDTFSLFSSAVELAEIGVRLTASREACFADMKLSKRFLFGELSLSPLFLDDVSACWLVNMAAFEACTATGDPSDGFVVSSYLSLLAMLMDKGEDAHKLRAKRIVQSFFSDQEILAFFKGIARHLRLGQRYFATTYKIEEYKGERRVWIVVHKFLYHNFKIIMTLLSIASVLVGIFKTLSSLKQH